jgi:hypothetical protein
MPAAGLLTVGQRGSAFRKMACLPAVGIHEYWYKAIERAEGRSSRLALVITRVREGDHRETLVAHF